MMTPKIQPRVPLPDLVLRSDCSHCNHTGQQYPECDECQGLGFIVDPETATTKDCPECENEPCNECYAP